MELPLPWLAGMVVVGVSFVTVLTWALGWAKPVLLTGPEDALSRLQTEVPDAQVADLVLADDGRAALFALQDGRVAVLGLFGDRGWIREVAPGFLRFVRPDGATLVVRFRDMGAPELRVNLSDPETQSAWLARIQEAARGGA